MILQGELVLLLAPSSDQLSLFFPRKKKFLKLFGNFKVQQLFLALKTNWKCFLVSDCHEQPCQKHGLAAYKMAQSRAHKPKSF